MAVPPGATDEDVIKRPARELLARIDIGLATGILGVMIALFSLFLGRSQAKFNFDSRAASVMPVVDVDLGYNAYDPYDEAKLTFTVSLENVGVGLANIRSITALVDGSPVSETAFQNAVMSPNMTAWAEVRDGAPLGYLQAGATAEPLAWVIVNPFQARAGDYFSGKLDAPHDVPLAGADVEVCYCSVFDTCWTVGHIDREPPEEVRSCGVDGAPEDAFQDWRDARLAAE